ncbi:MAG TPA: hypothetical protein VE441_12820 [Mycobacterium sp.]|nr:hypothetical protein [Mycobacterium sp.]
MSDPTQAGLADGPADPRHRAQRRAMHSAEARGVAAVCAAEAKVARAIGRLDQARAELAALSGLDRAALLLGISTSQLRQSVAAASGQGGAG